MKHIKVGLSIAALTLVAACASPYDWKPMDMPAPPKTETETRQFTVFFPWNSAQITPAGQRVVADAAAYIKAAANPEVTLQGMADTSGGTSPRGQAYNQRLSERRVQVVADAMQSMGVNTAGFTMRAVGDRILAVQTPPGVREQQNRRTDINVTAAVVVSLRTQ